VSRRNKQPIALCPGNARGRRKLKRYKAREKRKLYGQLYAEGFSPSGRALMTARRFAQQFMQHGMSAEDIRTLRDRFFKAFPHLKALAKQYKEELR